MRASAILPVARSLVSYVPSTSLIRLRELKDLPKIAAGRPHESDFLALRWWNVTSPNVLDVGANRGQSIRSLRAVLKSPVIHSFEPNPFLGRQLDVRFRNDPDVTIHQIALSDRDGRLDLYLPRYGHTVYDTRASLGPEEAERFLAPDHFVPFSAARAGIEQVSVAVRTIDGLGLHPDLVKVDVEGADDQVVAGGTETLTLHRPIVLVEHPRRRTTDLLESLGYVAHAFDARCGRLQPNEAGELNTYFLLPSHRDQFGGVLV